jgi:hypothetical protein
MKILFLFGISMLLCGALCFAGSFIFTSVELILIIVSIVTFLAGFGLLTLFGILHKIRGIHEFAMDIKEAYRDAQNDRRDHF